MNETPIIIAIVVVSVLVIASLVIGIINITKINTILDYAEDGDLVSNLKKYYNGVRELQKKLKISQEGAMSERISRCDTKINLSLSKTGVVNFDAFDDVFGKQSFSLALLDQYNTGFVITSLYGSTSSNTYVRTITEGKSDIPLLQEEKDAIMKAVSGNLDV